MRALVYEGPGSKWWKEVRSPTLEDETDGLVPVGSTICGPDIHILKGDVPEVTFASILGHETVESGFSDMDTAGHR